jgi:ferredoxin-NADP reductase
MLATEPALGEYIGTLERVYRLPQLGFVTQGRGRLEGRDAVSCVYRLPDGSSVVALRAIGAPLFAMRRVSNPETIQGHVWRDATGELEVTLEVAADRLVGVVVNGDWGELNVGVDLLLRQQPFSAWQAAVFAATGSLRLESRPHFGADDEVVCTCTGVALAALRHEIEIGVTHVDRLAEATGAGSVCSGCRPRLAELLGQSAWTPAGIAAATPLTEEIRAIRLKPWSGQFKPARPGQHVVLEALVNDQWVRRSYTLTTPASAQDNDSADYHEITIKREPLGLLSPRVFGREAEKLLFKLSEPQGEFCPPQEGAAPLVYIVAGIGLTPALAACRAFEKLGPGRRITVDYSARSEAEQTHAAELAALAAATPALTLCTRLTSSEGRLTGATLAAYVDRNPDAIFFVCGPEAFDQFVTETLRKLRVPQDRIRAERFTASGAPTRVRTADSSRHKPAPVLPGHVRCGSPTRCCAPIRTCLFKKRPRPFSPSSSTSTVHRGRSRRDSPRSSARSPKPAPTPTATRSSRTEPSSPGATRRAASADFIGTG